jgi:hypothetical protein
MNNILCFFLQFLPHIGASKPMIVAKTAVLTSYKGELTLVLINYIMLKL